VIRTGSIGIDIALGGGWRPGTMNEVWGDPGAGKTVLAKHTAENVVRARRDVLWVDVDGTVQHMDSAPGVIVARPRNAEQAFMMAWHACEVPEIALIVIDPAQRLVRQRELDGDPEYVPHPQREYRTELNLLKEAARANGKVVLFCSQPRDKQREPVRGTGISEKVAYRVHLHPDVVHQDGTREIVASVKDVRGDSIQYDAARYLVRPGTGIDTKRELVGAAEHYGIIKRHGSWLTYSQMRVQGRNELTYLLSTPRYSQQAHLLDEDVRRITGIS
jgi:recombination protein RecA